MEGDVEPIVNVPSEVGLRPALELEHPELAEKAQLEKNNKAGRIKINELVEKDCEEATGVETQTDEL